MRGPMRVFVSGDGGVDDLAALTMAVAAMMAGSIEIVGVAVTGGNCFLDAGVQATRKILDLAGLDAVVKVSTCDAEGVNPFPRSWRSASYGMCHIPRLLRDGRPRTQLLQTPAHMHLAECCMASDTPITVLETGPLTCMARALKAFPEVAKPNRISQLVWMGGAIDVEGNVHREGADGSAEWNVYWDPMSAKQVIDAGPKLRICPLDVCNQAPITTKFLEDLSLQAKGCSPDRVDFADITGQIFAPSMRSFHWGDEDEYGKSSMYAWDVLAASYTIWPDLFSCEEMSLDVSLKGPSEGRLFRSPGTKQVVKSLEVLYD